MSADTGHNFTQTDLIWIGNAEEMIDLYCKFQQVDSPWPH